MTENDHEAAPARHVFNAIQETAGMTETVEGHVLIGCVVIAEWLGPDGRRYLTGLSSDANGDGVPEWTVQGYLTNAIGGLAEWFYGRDDGDADG
jgi:hypothetical protein